jgi:hypothetical protein
MHGKSAIFGGFFMPLAVLFVFGGIGVDNRQSIHQSPRPVVAICNPFNKDMPKLSFGAGSGRVLQSYVFSYSVNDPKGSFSLTFHPDDDEGLYKDQSIFDKIEEMDVVQIFEYIDKTGNYPYATFTGVVRKKRFVIQNTDDGPRRSIVVTGHSIAGLVDEFYLSMDINAMAITREIANDRQIEIEVTQALMKNDNKGIKVSDAINIIWKSFLDLSNKYGRLSNVKTAEIIKKWMGENPFDVDEKLTFFYPIGSVFHGQSTKNFYSVVENLVSRPVYEYFPYIEKGKTKIKIRMSPFDADSWEGLNHTDKGINPVLLKTVDIAQSDEKVYTVFYSYLDGYPMQMDKALRLSTQKATGMPEVVIDEEKYGIYGYRPLFVTFHGYAKSPEDDTTTGEELLKLNNKLKKWFGKLEKMYSGSVTMSTDIHTEMPQAGEKIPLLGGEFYVVTSEHRWNYGGNPETALSVSRGGKYIKGSFDELKDIAKRYKELEDLPEWKT